MATVVRHLPGEGSAVDTKLSARHPNHVKDARSPTHSPTGAFLWCGHAHLPTVALIPTGRGLADQAERKRVVLREITAGEDSGAGPWRDVTHLLLFYPPDADLTRHDLIEDECYPIVRSVTTVALAMPKVAGLNVRWCVVVSTPKLRHRSLRLWFTERGVNDFADLAAVLTSLERPANHAAMRHSVLGRHTTPCATTLHNKEVVRGAPEVDGGASGGGVDLSGDAELTVVCAGGQRHGGQLNGDGGVQGVVPAPFEGSFRISGGRPGKGKMAYIRLASDTTLGGTMFVFDDATSAQPWLKLNLATCSAVETNFAPPARGKPHDVTDSDCVRVVCAGKGMFVFRGVRALQLASALRDHWQGALLQCIGDIEATVLGVRGVYEPKGPLFRRVFASVSGTPLPQLFVTGAGAWWPVADVHMADAVHRVARKVHNHLKECIAAIEREDGSDEDGVRRMRQVVGPYLQRYLDDPLDDVCLLGTWQAANVSVPWWYDEAIVQPAVAIVHEWLDKYHEKAHHRMVEAEDTEGFPSSAPSMTASLTDLFRFVDHEVVNTHARTLLEESRQVLLLTKVVEKHAKDKAQAQTQGVASSPKHLPRQTAEDAKHARSRAALNDAKARRLAAENKLRRSIERRHDEALWRLDAVAEPPRGETTPTFTASSPLAATLDEIEKSKQGPSVNACVAECTMADQVSWFVAREHLDCVVNQHHKDGATLRRTYQDKTTVQCRDAFDGVSAPISEPIYNPSEGCYTCFGMRLLDATDKFGKRREWWAVGQAKAAAVRIALPLWSFATSLFDGREGVILDRSSAGRDTIAPTQVTPRYAKKAATEKPSDCQTPGCKSRSSWGSVKRAICAFCSRSFCCKHLRFSLVGFDGARETCVECFLQYRDVNSVNHHDDVETASESESFSPPIDRLRVRSAYDMSTQGWGTTPLDLCNVASVTVVARTFTAFYNALRHLIAHGRDQGVVFLELHEMPPMSIGGHSVVVRLQLPPAFVLTEGASRYVCEIRFVLSPWRCGSTDLMRRHKKSGAIS
eukprot:m.8788 g.8788  ORF g.8788 m.8788 type:complete len:1028 (+) comp2565_c0_seq1:522-3605(+)